LDRTFEPHFGIVPIQRRVEVAPEQPFVIFIRFAEARAGSTQPADMLRRHATNQLAPRIIGVL